jgi:hypothetical protein
MSLCDYSICQAEYVHGSCQMAARAPLVLSPKSQASSPGRLGSQLSGVRPFLFRWRATPWLTTPPPCDGRLAYYSRSCTDNLVRPRSQTWLMSPPTWKQGLSLNRTKHEVIKQRQRTCGSRDRPLPDLGW